MIVSFSPFLRLWIKVWSIYPSLYLSFENPQPYSSVFLKIQHCGPYITIDIINVMYIWILMFFENSLYLNRLSSAHIVHLDPFLYLNFHIICLGNHSIIPYWGMVQVFMYIFHCYVTVIHSLIPPPLLKKLRRWQDTPFSVSFF